MNGLIGFQVICRKVKDQTLSGYTTIISAMGRESKTNGLNGKDLLTQCLIVQWFDYSVLFIDPAVESKASRDLVLQVRFENPPNINKNCCCHSDITVIFIHFVCILLSCTQELNDYLSTRSYLVGQSLTLADVVVYYSLSAIMSALSTASKEKYLNVSRWFEHVQKIGEIRQSLPLANLSTIYLHGWATGTHM